MRLRKRYLVPGLFLALLGLLLLWAYVHGTWADTAVKDPTSVGQGPVTQLYQAPDGRKQVRCAVLLDAPPDEVWAVVTDYEQFDSIFPYLRDVHAEKESDGGYRFQGTVSAGIFGDWGYDTHIRHEETPGRYVASWDEPGGELTVNRGSWQITHRDGGTLLVYTLDVEVRHCPTFLVRDVLLDRVKAIVGAVARRVRKQQGAAP